MALHLNLLHEEILEQKQRQRDPLKIGMLVLSSCGALLFLYYAWVAVQTLEIKSRLGGVERDWKKIEPTVTAAQKHAAELSEMIKTTQVLDSYIDNRFFWAPFLEKLSRCIAPNAQLTNLEGSVDEDKGVSITVEGVAAAREARAAAEDLRQMLSEQLSKGYHDVKVEFKTLEDLEAITNVGGVNMPMARYVLVVNFNTHEVKAEATPAAGHVKRK